VGDHLLHYMASEPKEETVCSVIKELISRKVGIETVVSVTFNTIRVFYEPENSSSPFIIDVYPSGIIVNYLNTLEEVCVENPNLNWIDLLLTVLMAIWLGPVTLPTQ